VKKGGRAAKAQELDAEGLAALVFQHNRLEDARLAVEAFRATGNAAHFWSAYLLARESGGELPSLFLAVFDDIAHKLLAAGTTDHDRLAAVGFPPRRQGERSPPSRAARQGRALERNWLIWLHATGGRPSEAPPEPLPRGTYEAVAARLNVQLSPAEKAAWKTEWRRFRAARSSEDKLARTEASGLQAALRLWSGDTC